MGASFRRFRRARRGAAPTPDRPKSAGRPEPEEAVEELAALSADMERRPPGATPEARERWYRRTGSERATVLVRTLAGLLGRGSVAAAKGAGVGGRALADRLVQAAPRIPVRDLATLRAHHPDVAGPEDLADQLVAGACRASSAVGASVGAAAMLPVPPAMAVEIAAETLAVAAVEIKLIAELHQVYGQPAAGTAAQRATAYVVAWANQRGIDPTSLVGPAGFAVVAVGSEVRQKLRRRLTRSTLRRLPSLTPLLVGAGFGATVNRRDTRKLADKVRADLRHRPPVDPVYWSDAAPGGPAQ
ncbi:hypothetical protein [Kitasatospora sp. GP82]|uniref:hypothetical protein n=1 Tax=Kitasatospora sp. GP82 TaxID=3035089 RepID=UPI002473EF37|nr:hypothetical protein [Kitasatospora sp. GP82]MDH6128902.1 hypothetical protein [Kitasatospora sp. GP82]